MPIKAVQQIMLGKVLSNEKQAAQTLDAIKNAGYDGIELCGFMIHKTPAIVRLLTKAAGMPTGNGGKLDWHKLIKNSELCVTSVHSDLGSIERDAEGVARDVLSFGTKYVVITGMYRFDYSNEGDVVMLAERLNKAGKALKGVGAELLYHNHNCELNICGGKTKAYDLLLDKTDPEYVNFEYDSYWFSEGGADVLEYMKKLGNRMKMWHINDRGFRSTGKTITPIVKSDSMELGYGNMPLDKLTEQALSANVEAVILESHKNHIDGDAIKSLTLSAEYLNGRIK